MDEVLLINITTVEVLQQINPQNPVVGINLRKRLVTVVISENDNARGVVEFALTQVRSSLAVQFHKLVCVCPLVTTLLNKNAKGLSHLSTKAER